MKKSIFFKLSVMLSFLFFTHLLGVAQTTLTGTVKDEEGYALSGVNILIKGTTERTITGMDGNYSIFVPNGNSVLQFSYIGFKTQEIVVGNQKVIDVVLKEDIALLDELVVVGYGTLKKSDVTGALVRIGENEIKAIPAQNALQAMQGKMAGVDITSNERPGEMGKILIRGERSFGGVNGKGASNDPLYVVDGVPIQTGGIENLNPSDIASIDVLKDASATAIYGHKGANGVVLVTTKRGQSGKLQLNYSGSVSIAELYDRTTMMNSAEWLEYSRAAKMWGKTDLSISEAQDKAWFGGDPYAWANIEKGWAGGSWDGSKVPTFNWTDYGKQTGITHEHTLSASGGSNNIQAYGSFGYLNQESTQPGQSYERFTGNAGVDLQATGWFKLGSSINVMYGDQEYGYDFRKSTTGADDIYHALQGMLPWTVPYTPEGEYIRNPGADVNIINPIREVDLCRNNRQNFRALGSFYGELSFGNIFSALNGLRYRILFGPELRYTRKGIADAAESINGDGHSTAQYDTDFRRSWTFDNLVYYDKTFGTHGIGLTLLHTASAYHKETSSMKSFVASNRELWYQLQSASNIQTYDSDLSESNMESCMARLNYSFSQKYLLTVSGRWDAASQLAEGHQWDFFSSMALGWRIEQESFMKNVNWVDQLKLRLGYGTTGNSSSPPYVTLGSVTSNFYHFGSSTAIGMVASDPSLAVADQVAMANPLLGWEKTTQYNLGIDFSLFKGRINGTIDLYTSRTNELLMRQSIPPLTGYPNTWANVGTTKNNGIDVSINTINVQTKDFTWSSSLTYFANRDEITQLTSGSKEDLGNSWFVGQPLSVFYDYVYDGVWKTSEKDEAAKFGRLPGELKVKDLSGPDGIPDGKIDANYDRQVVGHVRPDWSGGFQNTFRYKHVDLSFFLFGRFGHTIQAGAEALSGRFAMRKLDYWIAGTNEDALYYAPGINGENGDTYKSAMNYQDGSYIKLRNISLGYTFSPQIAKKAGISNLKIYVQCMNPGLLYSKVDYLDPDVYLDTNMTGTSYNRSIVFGLNIGF